jgi:hypothetical protein
VKLRKKEKSQEKIAKLSKRKKIEKKKPISKSIKHNPSFLIKKTKGKESHGGAGLVVVD